VIAERTACVASSHAVALGDLSAAPVLLKNIRLRHCRAVLEEIEVSTLIRLRHVFHIKLRVAALVALGRGFPGSTAFFELFVANVKV
jgi:hypothetical protein